MKNWLPRFRSSKSHSEIAPTAEGRSIELPFDCEQSGGVAVPNRQKIQRQLHASCQRQLQILRRVMQLSSAVILWTGPEPEELSLYAFSSENAQLEAGPFLCGAGMTGVLKEHDELLLAPVTNASPAIPYYRSNEQVGSFMALKLKGPGSAGCQQGGTGLLCIDRSSAEVWGNADLVLLREVAEQITADVSMARQLFVYDRERHAYRRAFDGLRKLNSALSLESTFTATAEAIKVVVPADFFSISLVDEEKEEQQICYVTGHNEEQLSGQSFPLQQGLVGQVIKYRRTLPDNADYKGTTPVFSSAHLFAEYRSLMVVPLLRDDGPVIGAMTVAAKDPDKFTRTCREMLELIATQVVVKIELAYSHDQINRMATIDALTGIANRRAYQCGFEAMLDRAKRRSGSLQLILCDIDNFKRINDTYGHPFGDEVLRQVAKLFDRVVRTVDLAARTGGEEFAILLEDSDPVGAWKVAERLRLLVCGTPMNSGGGSVPVSISLGIASYPENAQNMEKLVSCADQALYQAKNAGRNKTVVWQA